jgi:single-stranded-DNA-specific exonuclease
MKHWKVLKKLKKNSTEEIKKILFVNRGLKSKKDVDFFINPQNPKEITAIKLGIRKKELNKALGRICTAIEKKEKIVVYGDYDCDGITATAILWEQLYFAGADVLPYIPDRIEDGYGLSESGLNKLKEQIPDTKLVITVDHGITAVEQARFAQEKLGLELIITDHHTKGRKTPKAYAIIHTTNLSGAGIAWFLAREIIDSFFLRKTLPQGKKPTTSLDLAALGTIADMVSLQGHNRSIAKFGLEEIHKTERIGLLALIYESGLAKDQIGAYEIGFMLAPRLNALGRIDNAMDALRLLCTKDTVRAAKLAKKLNDVNLQRQKLTEETVVHAKNLVLNSGNKKLLFISHESYNQGIIGLVAGKLTEAYYLPAIVVAKGEKISKASARSINGFNIVNAIRSFSDILINVGGHPMAAGFTVETEKLEILRERLEFFASQQITDDLLTRELKIDCEMDLENINWELENLLEQFRPFGTNNPEPVFSSKVKVSGVRIIGKTAKHLKLTVHSCVSGADQQLFDAVAFNFADLYDKIKPTDTIEIAYMIEKNEWGGEKKLQLKIRDIKTKIR